MGADARGQFCQNIRKREVHKENFIWYNQMEKTLNLQNQKYRAQMNIEANGKGQPCQDHNMMK